MSETPTRRVGLVLPDLVVRRKQDQAADHGLCDEHTVERVSMKFRELPNVERGLLVDGKRRFSALSSKLRVPASVLA